MNENVPFKSGMIVGIVMSIDSGEVKDAASAGPLSGMYSFKKNEKTVGNSYADCPIFSLICHNLTWKSLCMGIPAKISGILVCKNKHKPK